MALVPLTQPNGLPIYVNSSELLSLGAVGKGPSDTSFFIAAKIVFRNQTHEYVRETPDQIAEMVYALGYLHAGEGVSTLEDGQSMGVKASTGSSFPNVDGSNTATVQGALSETKDADVWVDPTWRDRDLEASGGDQERSLSIGTVNIGADLEWSDPPYSVPAGKPGSSRSSLPEWFER